MSKKMMLGEAMEQVAKECPLAVNSEMVMAAMLSRIDPELAKEYLEDVAIQHMEELREAAEAMSTDDEIKALATSSLVDRGNDPEKRDCPE
jgi:precorrin isomerase